MCKGDVLESGFLSFILGMPLVLNAADKVAVRGQINSKAPYDFTGQHYYIFKDRQFATCINHSVSHRNINPHKYSALVLNFTKSHNISVGFHNLRGEENLT